MDREDVRRWVDRYEQVWRTAGTEGVGELFTDDASYLTSPWAEPIRGLPALRDFWEAGRDGPDERFTMSSRVLAVDGDTAVVRVEVAYGDARGGDRWRDLWVMAFDEVDAPGGPGTPRCRAFEEWPIAPPSSRGDDES